MASGKDPVTRPNGGTDRSYQIEAEIDRTRAAMDRTVDLIAGKLTPQQLAMEALGVFKDGSSALATRVIQTAREHPVPATIIGIGIGLLLTESRKAETSERAFAGDRHLGFAGEGRPVAEAVKDTVASGAQEAKEKVGEVASQVKDQAIHVGEQVREQASHLREQVREGADQVRAQAARVPVQAQKQWHDAQLGFWQTMDERPFAIGIAALAIGVAAGLAVPATRKEQELMGETRDRLLDQAKGYTREAVDKGRQVARVAADTVKSEVERQGLTTSAIADKVRSIGREAEQALKSEAEKVMPEPLKATGSQTVGGGAGQSSQGGAAGRGMSAGFASTSASEMWDPDNTLPGGPKTPRT